MWCVTLLLIAVANCNAEELLQIKTEHLPTAPSSRIIGGSATTIERYPFTVQVIYGGRFICGGSLLTQRHVLSAAHCFVDDYGNVLNASSYTIRVGTTYLNSGGVLYRVSAIIVHELYNNPIRDNDVAIVVMSSSANLSASVNIVAIPYQWDVVPDNSSVIAVGWGLTNVNNAGASPVLNEVTVQKINRSICQERYLRLQVQENIPFPVTSSMICAGILDVGGKDACQGDSGGPLIFDGIVVGVTSWGAGCAEPQYPGVSARVASYSNWIVSTVERYNAGSLSSNVGAITLLTPVLYLILSL